VIPRTGVTWLAVPGAYFQWRGLFAHALWEMMGRRGDGEIREIREIRETREIREIREIREVREVREDE
jgi:hypothetical protein